MYVFEKVDLTSFYTRSCQCASRAQFASSVSTSIFSSPTTPSCHRHHRHCHNRQQHPRRIINIFRRNSARTQRRLDRCNAARWRKRVDARRRRRQSRTTSPASARPSGRRRRRRLPASNVRSSATKMTTTFEYCRFPFSTPEVASRRRRRGRPRRWSSSGKRESIWPGSIVVDDFATGDLP